MFTYISVSISTTERQIDINQLTKNMFNISEYMINIPPTLAYETGKTCH